MIAPCSMSSRWPLKRSSHDAGDLITSVCVGLDVHACLTHATVLDCGPGELSACRLRGAPEVSVSRLSRACR